MSGTASVTTARVRRVGGGCPVRARCVGGVGMALELGRGVCADLQAAWTPNSSNESEEGMTSGCVGGSCDVQRLVVAAVADYRWRMEVTRRVRVGRRDAHGVELERGEEEVEQAEEAVCAMRWWWVSPWYGGGGCSCDGIDGRGVGGEGGG